MATDRVRLVFRPKEPSPNPKVHGSPLYHEPQWLKWTGKHRKSFSQGIVSEKFLENAEPMYFYKHLEFN